jgi:segregation and condensation protein B
MPPSADPPFNSQQQGISLDELAQAFAQVMGVEPKRAVEPAALPAADPLEHGEPATTEPAAVAVAKPAMLEDACPISPRTILEAMLFVGAPDNRPLSPARAAELMRDVEAAELPALVKEMNHRYAAEGSPYCIVGEGDGYRLTLRGEFRVLRNRFYGRIREARLSQAAIDVLALAAYQQPITNEKISRLRGKPSSHLLAHLVRRGLLRIERPDVKRRTPHYYTTGRFLRLFNLESLDDLPRGEDSEPT